MTAFSRLTGTIILPVVLPAILVCGIAAWSCGGPPQVIGNRPVSLDTGEANAPQADAAAHPALAAVLPDDEKKGDPGQVAAPAEPAEPRTPAAELKHAREQLKKCKSISAKIVEKIEVLEKSYKAEGRYLQSAQKANDWRMRFELVVKIGKSEGSLMEVCDGDVLWTRLEVDPAGKTDKKAPKDQMLTRRSITDIMSAARKLGDAKIEDQIVVDMGLGGLPALIAALQQDIKFESMTDGTLRDRPVSVIHGTWSDALGQRLRAGLQPPPGSAPGVAALLPAYVPDAVRIYIDRETGFPHRIMYLKKLVGRDVHKPMVTLDFLDVVLNQAINQQEFDYVPPEGVTPTELTKLIVDRLNPPAAQPAPGAKPSTP